MSRFDRINESLDEIRARDPRFEGLALDDLEKMTTDQLIELEIYLMERYWHYNKKDYGQKLRRLIHIFYPSYDAAFKELQDDLKKIVIKLAKLPGYGWMKHFGCRELSYGVGDDEIYDVCLRWPIEKLIDELGYDFEDLVAAFGFEVEGGTASLNFLHNRIVYGEMIKLLGRVGDRKKILDDCVKVLKLKKEEKMNRFNRLRRIVEEVRDFIEQDEPTGPRTNYERFVAHFGHRDWADKIKDSLGDEAEDFFAMVLPPRGTAVGRGRGGGEED